MCFRIFVSSFFAILLFSTPTFAERIEGTYLVPESDSLSEEVMVELKRARFRATREGYIKFEYKLPSELAGINPPKFVLEGPVEGPAPWELAGEGVVAVCLPVDSLTVDCSMRYDQVPNGPNGQMIFDIDIEAADAFLDSRSDLDRARIQELKSASRALRDEAIGIVRIRVRN